MYINSNEEVFFKQEALEKKYLASGKIKKISRKKYKTVKIIIKTQVLL